MAYLPLQVASKLTYRFDYNLVHEYDYNQLKLLRDTLASIDFYYGDKANKEIVTLLNTIVKELELKEANEYLKKEMEAMYSITSGTTDNKKEEVPF